MLEGEGRGLHAMNLNSPDQRAGDRRGCERSVRCVHAFASTYSRPGYVISLRKTSFSLLKTLAPPLFASPVSVFREALLLPSETGH